MQQPVVEHAERIRVLVLGAVQGVGFRPFVYSLAGDHELAGWVRNTSSGVELEVEGGGGRIASFLTRLASQPPRLARVDSVTIAPRAVRGTTGFHIRGSRRNAGTREIVPDAATCDACRAEVFDPRSRRHRYPFTNCANCGPRFTIIEALPYDRTRTSMRCFRMCTACAREYQDSRDRRYHAEPIACAECGPALRLLSRDGVTNGEDAIIGAVAALRRGEIVALKGLGGYQLAVAAEDGAAVDRLRLRKQREAKPFAVMAASLQAARAHVIISTEEGALLTSWRAPIVLLPKTSGSTIAPQVAPGLSTLGVMLPATPLHHLLAKDFGGPLVMTSGNSADEPIAVDDEEAAARLNSIADHFLVHNRAITARYDDSVVRVDGARPVVVRRARGYAPEPIRIPVANHPPVLAFGAQMKNTFCLVSDGTAYVSQHNGDLDSALAISTYHENIAAYCRMFGIDPAAVAHDLHPDYASSRAASGFADVAIAVQHHHAHAASCLAEHGRREPAIAVVFDGNGLGTDGTMWGGELLVVQPATFRRVGHLECMAVPGGDAAAREPWRMALALLALSFGSDAASLAAQLLPQIPAWKRANVFRLIDSGVATWTTSSAGRLFDGIAALLGIAHENRYEGEAAMRVETISQHDEAANYELPFDQRSRTWRLEPLVTGAVSDIVAGVSRSAVAARFHNALAAGICDASEIVRRESKLNVIVLSGGCFQNQLLLARCRRVLEDRGFEVLAHERIPANDGGISLGQAYVAISSLLEAN